jgi:hypothetical protein
MADEPQPGNCFYYPLLFDKPADYLFEKKFPDVSQNISCILIYYHR